jgi:hypothetical protein
VHFFQKVWRGSHFGDLGLGYKGDINADGKEVE